MAVPDLVSVEDAQQYYENYRPNPAEAGLDAGGRATVAGHGTLPLALG